MAACFGCRHDSWHRGALGLVGGGGVCDALWYLCGVEAGVGNGATVKDQPQCPPSSTNILPAKAPVIHIFTHPVPKLPRVLQCVRGRKVVALPLFYFSMAIVKFRQE